MNPFPIVQEINGRKITFRQDNDCRVYPTRELVMPSGEAWRISVDEVEEHLPTYVDDTIAFYVELSELTDCSDDELRDLIGDCT